MSARASMPSSAPVTRRQIRETERQQEAGKVEASRRASSELPRTRAARRAAERAAQRPRRRLAAAVPGARWMPRAAVLGALGAATIVAPLVGFAGAGTSAPVEPAPVVAVPAGQSVLDALDTAAQEHLADAGGDASAVMADNGAAARALVQSSRSIERSGVKCGYSAGSGANGAGAALLGESVVMPLAATTYTQSSLYGHRVHPINGAWAMHAGLDFAAPLGTPVHAVADGEVVHAGEGLDGRSSMLVIVAHEIDGTTFYSWYVHMYPDGVFVEEGQQVRAGEVIAEVGNNGNSTGPHLHLEIHLDQEGTTTDPGSFLADHDAVLLDSDC